MDNVLYLILLVSEMLKIPRDKVEDHFLKNIAFITNKCLLQDAFGECLWTKKTFQKTQQYANSYLHKFSYILVCSTRLSW